MPDDLMQAIEASDVAGAHEQLTRELAMGRDAWDIHLSLFPVVQRVLNPPFINPHLPKMHAIVREFLPYLTKEDLPALLRVEVTEYTQRPKLQQLPKLRAKDARVSFQEVGSAISAQDWERTALLLATFHAQRGAVETVRRLLLLGSGYLDRTLGHAISCTAFILLEMLARNDQDPWPALAALADYYCKGRIETTPAPRRSTGLPSDRTLRHQLLRATSGGGIVNLHHTITMYAVKRVGSFFNEQEYNHLLGAWLAFMGDKEVKQVELEAGSLEPLRGYDHFYESFSRLEAKPVVASVAGMITSAHERRRLGRFLIKGVCGLYQGDYNPHYLTGLGSALWVLDQYWNHAPIVFNALAQYLDFFFAGIRPGD
jgi:hypothetical protein